MGKKHHKRSHSESDDEKTPEKSKRHHREKEKDKEKRRKSRKEKDKDERKSSTKEREKTKDRRSPKHRSDRKDYKEESNRDRKRSHSTTAEKGDSDRERKRVKKTSDKDSSPTHRKSVGSSSSDSHQIPHSHSSSSHHSRDRSDARDDSRRRSSSEPTVDPDGLERCPNHPCTDKNCHRFHDGVDCREFLLNQQCRFGPRCRFKHRVLLGALRDKIRKQSSSESVKPAAGDASSKNDSTFSSPKLGAHGTSADGMTASNLTSDSNRPPEARASGDASAPSSSTETPTKGVGPVNDLSPMSATFSPIRDDPKEGDKPDTKEQNLPEPWEVYHTDDGTPYYHNPETGVVAWTLPGGIDAV